MEKKYLKVQDVSLGQEIIIFINKFGTSLKKKIPTSKEVKGTFIAKHNTDINANILGSKEASIDFPHQNNLTSDQWINYGYSIAENISDYKWYRTGTTASSSCSFPIFNKDQKCLSCSISSPHQNPNIKKKEYICSFCKFANALK